MEKIYQHQSTHYLYGFEQGSNDSFFGKPFRTGSKVRTSADYEQGYEEGYFNKIELKMPKMPPSAFPDQINQIGF